jgi:hypothetical protein
MVDMSGIACGGLIVRGSVLRMPAVVRSVLAMRRSVLGCLSLGCAVFLSFLTPGGTHEREAAKQSKQRSHDSDCASFTRHTTITKQITRKAAVFANVFHL